LINGVTGIRDMGSVQTLLAQSLVLTKKRLQDQKRSRSEGRMHVWAQFEARRKAKAASSG